MAVKSHSTFLDLLSLPQEHGFGILPPERTGAETGQQ
jgi:hypothetical protein